MTASPTTKPAAKPALKPAEDKIGALIVSPLAELGYELVRAQLSGGGVFVTLQIMAERVDGKAMTVEDCARISHEVARRLEQEPELSRHATLEVSSPGIDRPLLRLKDYERFAGHVARIELAAAIEGRKRFQGKIVRVTGETAEAEIEFSTDTGAVRVPMQSIARAKLVLTGDLLKQAAAAQTAGG